METLDLHMEDVYVRYMMKNRDIYQIMKDRGSFEYGTIINGSELRHAFDIEGVVYPAMKKDIDRVELEELSAADYIRNRLLNEGKYFKQSRDSYRVLLPSENAAQVISYMNSADNKLKRGIKLNKNTPSEYKISSNDEVRAILKIESIKEL